MITGKKVASGGFGGKRILIVDRDANLCQMLALIFERSGASVCIANEGREGLRQVFKYRPDLLILDVNLPDINGWDMCQQVRSLSETPVLILSSAQDREDIIRGLDLGADDYVTKPFDLDVLLARSRAILRRTGTPKRKEPVTAYSDGYLTVDFAKHRVFADGRPVNLTASEFQLLSYLFQPGTEVGSQ